MSQAASSLHAQNDNLALPTILDHEPVSRTEDGDEYRKALVAFKTGKWDADRWKTFRLRFGVYAELEPGLHMIRVKIPGGRLSHAWLRSLAEVNKTLCKGHIHFTTRQDVQIYGIDLDATADVIDALASHGLTTRDSSGSTFRKVTERVCGCRSSRRASDVYLAKASARSAYAAQIQVGSFRLCCRLRRGFHR